MWMNLTQQKAGNPLVVDVAVEQHAVEQTLGVWLDKEWL